ncbi:hypothetical protein SHKM778_25980 [Streptomyces sp. KM77-8]|uniref:AMP-binding enzyme C-terminal domain-containing protein n=1 Tax=Streptomyces haneummycinicus TaxID=3074435 RepID=A0AAT9HFV9_9ACTN
MPDDFLGERTCACLVRAEGAEEMLLPDLKRAMQARGLADYKLPDRLVYLEDLPLTGLGKTDKKALGALLRGETPAEAGRSCPPATVRAEHYRRALSSHDRRKARTAHGHQYTDRGPGAAHPGA